MDHPDAHCTDANCTVEERYFSDCNWVAAAAVAAAAGSCSCPADERSWPFTRLKRTLLRLKGCSSFSFALPQKGRRSVNERGTGVLFGRHLIG